MNISGSIRRGGTTEFGEAGVPAGCSDRNSVPADLATGRGSLEWLVNLARKGKSNATTTVAARTREIREVYAPNKPNLKKSDLKPGDILLLLDEKENTEKLHKLIIAGQKLEGLLILRKNSGKAGFVHAAMWTRNGGNPLETTLGMV